MQGSIEGAPCGKRAPLSSYDHGCSIVKIAILASPLCLAREQKAQMIRTAESRSELSSCCSAPVLPQTPRISTSARHAAATTMSPSATATPGSSPSSTGYVPFAQRPGWHDLQPVPQQDAPNCLVPIAYTEQCQSPMANSCRDCWAPHERANKLSS